MKCLFRAVTLVHFILTTEIDVEKDLVVAPADMVVPCRACLSIVRPPRIPRPYCSAESSPLCEHLVDFSRLVWSA